MSKWYNPKKDKATTNFDPNSKSPFRLSRSKIDLFMNCPRCFYLDRRLGVPQPPGFPFSLNSAVDTLLKKEFDVHRINGTAHPMMEAYGIDAIPFQHPDLNGWRESNFGKGGIRHLHKETGFDVGGAIDDLWTSPEGQIFVVDYKSTAKQGEVSLNADWQIGYKRQMEVYQWLFRKNGFDVSDTAYFVYVNGKLDAKAFDGKLEFDVRVIPYEGNGAWIETALENIKTCLMSEEIPMSDSECDFCTYYSARQEVENKK